MQLTSLEINKEMRRSYTIDELENLPKLNWLIKDILIDGGIATIYGESGSTKSFLAIDLAMHLATGSEWFGLEVNRGIPIIYTALEGFRGVVKRIKGWCKKNEISPSNIFIDHDSLLLGEQGSVESFINYYKANNFLRGMIIIDTFNMACPNIEENSAKEMSGVITKAKLIAEKLNSTVLIIHHSGKDESRGMRGSSSLKASMDTIIYVKQDSNGNCEWSLEKSKDSECGIRYGYRLETIEVEMNGEVETTCTIEKLGEILEIRKKVNLTVNQKRIMSLLKDRLLPLTSGHESMDIVIEQCCNLWTEHQKDKRTYDMRNIISSLVNKGLVGAGSRGNLSDQVWITDKGMKE
ncbi:MAG: helicase RepA family protein [Limnohabitans sp.]|nr:helicase RepA family protein [Limnohabitans sp.]